MSTMLLEAEQKLEKIQYILDLRNGNRKDCLKCGKDVPFKGAVYCSEVCAGYPLSTEK